MNKFILLVIFLLLSSTANDDLFFDKKKTESSFVISRGTTVEAFDSLTGFVQSGINGSYSIDTTPTNVREGTGSLLMTARAAGVMYATKPLGVTLSDASNLTVDIGIPQDSIYNVIDASIYLSSTPDFSKYLRFTAPIAASEFTTNSTGGIGAHYRFSQLLISPSEFTNIGGDTFSSAAYLRVGVNFRSAGSFYWDGLKKNYQQTKPAVILTFDDGYNSDFTYAFPTLTSNGQRATFYTITSAIFAAGDHRTVAQSLKMQAAGNDISNHSLWHPNLSALANFQITLEVVISDLLLKLNGFSTGAKQFAYPFGEYKPADTTYYLTGQLLPQYCDMARGYRIFLKHYPMVKMNDPDIYAKEKYMLYSTSVSQATDLGTVFADIDNLITSGGTMILSFHKLQPSALPQDLPTNPVSKFNSISNYIKTKTDAGLLQVITMSDYANSYK